MKDVILARALAFSRRELELIAQLGAEERRRVRRRGWRARLVGEPDQPAPEAREPRVLTLVLDLLLKRRGRQVAPEARDDETLAWLVAPGERRIERPPRHDLGERLDRGDHEQLEDEDDVAEEAELGVILEHEPVLTSQIERQQVARRGTLDGEGRVQAQLTQQRRVALGQVHRAFEAEDHARGGHARPLRREVVEHLGAGDVKFRSGELQVLGLDGKGSDLEAKRAAGARALARVRVAQQRRHIASAHAHDGIGECGEARDHDESRGVKGACDTNGEAAGCKVAADHREQPQQVRLRLVAHLLRRPEALARALGVVMGERQRQHGGDEMLNECDPQQVRVGHVAHLVREHLAQLDRVTKRHRHLVQRLDLISHAGELYG